MESKIVTFDLSVDPRFNLLEMGITQEEMERKHDLLDQGVEHLNWRKVFQKKVTADFCPSCHAEVNAETVSCLSCCTDLAWLSGGVILVRPKL